MQATYIKIDTPHLACYITSMKHKRILFHLIILLALVCNTAFAFAASSKQGFLSDSLLICTTEGLKWITLDKDKQGNNAPSHKVKKCVLCTIHMDGKHMVAQPELVVAVLYTPLPQPYKYDEVDTKNTAYSNYYMTHTLRGPPHAKTHNGYV